MVCAFAKTENPASDLALGRMLGGKKTYFWETKPISILESTGRVVRQGETKPLIGVRPSYAKASEGVPSRAIAPEGGSQESEPRPPCGPEPLRAAGREGAGNSRSHSRQGGIGMT